MVLCLVCLAPSTSHAKLMRKRAWSAPCALVRVNHLSILCESVTDGLSDQDKEDNCRWMPQLCLPYS